MSEETRRRAATEGPRDSPSAAKETPSQETLRLYEFGPFRLDPAERKLLRGNEIMALTPKAFDTLHLLVRNSGHLLKKDELIRMLWPDTFVEEGSLSNNIFLLRKVLGEDPAFIETVPRRGYRFVGAVRQFPRAAPTHLEKPPEVGAPGIASLPAKARRPWRSRALGIAAIALLGALAVAGWFHRSAGRGSETIDSLAVLPFVNASGDPKTEYLSDGITESLINNFTQLRGLRVMARSTVFRFKGKDVDPQKIGRDLQVRAVLTGRLLQREDTLIVQTELVDVEKGSELWGAQYKRKLADVLAVQEDIAQEISRNLRLRLTGEDEKRMAKSYTANPEAYQDYLKGRYSWNKRTDEGLNKGIEYFQKAIAKDPTYALAYSGLADCYSLLAVYGALPPKEASPKAKEAALKALELDETLAEAHVSLARIKAEYDWDWVGGEREFQRAIQLNPNYATAHQWYGDVLETMGRLEEAIAEYKRALELDPVSLIINRGVGQAFYYARQYDQAIGQLQKTLELAPYFPGTRYFISRSYLQKSMYKEGIAEFEKELVIYPSNAFGLASLGYAYAVAGRRPEAQKVLDRLNELSKQDHVAAPQMAVIYTGLGEKDKAFEWLGKSYEERSIGLGGEDIKAEPVYDPLRSDPRFTDLLRRMNLQP